MNRNFTLFYRFNKKCCNILLLVFCVLSCGAFAKENVNATNKLFKVVAQHITGEVSDATGNPLPGVSIKVKGTTNGTMTDGAGKFSLNLPDGNTTLIISYIGYKTREVVIAGQINIHISLVEDQSKLNEVVVMGYSKQSRETITTSVAKLDTKVLESIPYSNVTSALQGTLPGVRATSTTGQPGEPPRIIIRGGTSINNPDGAAPLYVVDGVIRPQLYNINSGDVESIQVLKDAAATAIYGARASNGVVIVTTKSGKSGKFAVNFNSDYTVSAQGKMYQMANASDYLTLFRLGEVAAPKFVYPSRIGQAIGYGTGNDLTNNTAYSTQYLTTANAYKLQQGWQQMPDPLDPSKTILFSNTDFQKLAYQTATSSNNFVSVSGGTDKAKLYTSLGYLTNEGPVITTGYKRISFSLNGDIKLNDKFSVFGRVSFENSSENQPNLGYDQLFYRGAGLAPTAKLYFEDGTLAPGTNASIGNPLYQLNTRINKNTSDYTTVSAGAHYNILPGLTFDPTLSTFRALGDAYNFQKAYYNGPTTYDVSRNASESVTRYVVNQIDAVLSYKKTFWTNNNIDSRVGFSYYNRRNQALNAAGKGASTDIVPTLNASATPVSVSSTISDQVLLGYFGNINYDYKQKYLVGVNARFDGASNLGTQHKYGIFPGVSVGWNVDKEDFWDNLPANLIKLKLRASYGINGNISGLGDYTSQGVYSVGSIYGGAGGIINSVLPNNDLQWERSKTLNFGTDIGLFNGRINVIVDAYRRVTDHLLTSLALPLSTGFSSIFTNFGTLENRGFEVEVNANILAPASKVKWNMGFNASKVATKILKLPNNGIANNRVGGVYVYDTATGSYMYKGGLQEGGRIGEMYDRKEIGIYATDAEAAKAPTDTYITLADKTKYGGDTKWLDVDGNGIIDSRDQVYVGNQFPNFNGGFSNAVSYKGFELYVRTDFTTGQTIFNWAEMFLEGNLYGDGNTTQRKVDNAWKQQGDVTQYSRFYFGGERYQHNDFNGTATSGNSLYDEKGDFLCLREVTLSYNIPQSLLRKVKINGLRIHFTGNNLHYFTKYSGLNPEDGGVDNGRYAMPRNYIFGLNLTL